MGQGAGNSGQITEDLCVADPTTTTTHRGLWGGIREKHVYTCVCVRVCICVNVYICVYTCVYV